MIIEKALVQYNKNGEYNYTIESDFVEIDHEPEILQYIENNTKKDIEFYFYKTKEDVENNNAIETIICNEILK